MLTEYQKTNLRTAEHFNAIYNMLKDGFVLLASSKPLTTSRDFAFAGITEGKMKFFAEIAKENGQKTIENIRTGERLALLDGRTVLQNDGLTVNYYTTTDGTGEGVTEFILTNCVGETKVFVCNAFAGEKVINEYLWEIIANTLDCQKVETLLTAWQNEA